MLLAVDKKHMYIYVHHINHTSSFHHLTQTEALKYNFESLSLFWALWAGECFLLTCFSHATNVFVVFSYLSCPRKISPCNATWRLWCLVWPSPPPNGLALSRFLSSDPKLSRPGPHLRKWEWKKKIWESESDSAKACLRKRKRNTYEKVRVNCNIISGSKIAW